ncbi:hypothetical protein, partial [Haloquadratum walsbyi]|uniref:hypothetical protein n=1 Tax=Haloquadratum walsbyi TaxID=293091 RepID=UPI0026ED419A
YFYFRSRQFSVIKIVNHANIVETSIHESRIMSGWIRANLKELTWQICSIQTCREDHNISGDDEVDYVC